MMARKLPWLVLFHVLIGEIRGTIKIVVRVADLRDLGSNSGKRSRILLFGETNKEG
jgi:hypothetical protein